MCDLKNESQSVPKDIFKVQDHRCDNYKEVSVSMH